MFGWWKQRRRQQLTKQTFPKEWETILQRRVTHYRQVAPELRHRLQTIVQILAAERPFEGCGGLQLTDEVRITICGQAALLLLGVDGYFFDRVPSIIVYPDSFSSHTGNSGGLIVDEDQTNLGEAWKGGPIILSWKSVRHAGQHSDSGHNVVVHEFAHHLDGLDGEMGGQPPMPSSDFEARWNQVLEQEFNALVQATRHGHPTLIDPYGATNRAEFFAVSTEAFFESPQQLKHYHSEWYELLAGFYHLDPASWDWHSNN